jgi:hypothetical protein
MMPPIDPALLMAERRLSLRGDDGSEREVIVRLGRPEPDPTPGGAWRCRMEILGLPSGDLSRDVHGEDSLQALILALELAHIDLTHLPAATSLTWSGDPDLGLLPRRL